MTVQPLPSLSLKLILKVLGIELLDDELELSLAEERLLLLRVSVELCELELP